MKENTVFGLLIIGLILGLIIGGYMGLSESDQNEINILIFEILNDLVPIVIIILTMTLTLEFLLRNIEKMEKEYLPISELKKYIVDGIEVSKSDYVELMGKEPE